jgi:hypothetical protein
MKKTLGQMLIVLVAASTLGACDHAKSTAQVAKDTSNAEQKAIEDVQKSERDAEHLASVQNQKMADTAAEGAHKVALAQCESLSGTAQKSCRDQADADYQVAKAQAKQDRADSDPKP